MNNYTVCLRNGIKLALNKRGEVFITSHGYINLSGKPKQTICERSTRAVLAGIACEASLTTEENGRMRLRKHKLIPSAIALEWLAKDNPELAEAAGDDLFEFLGQSVDLSQYHKPKAVEVVDIVPAETGNNLERYDCNGVELVIDRVTGEAWATVRGYARMSDKPQSTVQSRLDRMPEGERNALTKVAVIGIPQSVQGGEGERINAQNVRLVPASLCFKWAIKDNPKLAEAMGAAGATVYMHQLAGFKITSDAIAKPDPQPTPQPQQLTPADRIKLAAQADGLFAKYGMDTNPRYSQAAKDFIGDILGMNQNTLPAPDAPKWYGVAERAEQLGYPVALVVRHRSPLGCWVAKRVSGSRKESRLCNGTERPINLYRVTPELDAAIASYFDRL